MQRDRGVHPPATVCEVSAADGARLFDGWAHRLMGMSGPEFLRRYDAGDLDTDDPAAARLAMLIPFTREVPTSH
jgi:hypothetical protein